LSTGTLATQSYTATDGTTGEQDIWTITVTTNNSSSVSTVTIAAVPHGSTWLIDNVDEEANVSGGD
jgi:hypothetical protein